MALHRVCDQSFDSPETSPKRIRHHDAYKSLRDLASTSISSSGLVCCYHDACGAEVKTSNLDGKELVWGNSGSSELMNIRSQIPPLEWRTIEHILASIYSHFNT